MQIEPGKEKEYADWKEKNGTPNSYGGAPFVVAEKWADLMEARMKADHMLRVDDIAEETCDEATKGSDITGFQFGCVVSILANCWSLGDELRRWHNLDTQIGNEGEKANEKGGVLNPALLSVG